jgi:hypothetical protein
LADFIMENIKDELVKSITHHPKYMKYYEASFIV